MRSNKQGILDSNHVYEVATNKHPINIANILKPGLIKNPEIVLSLVVHQGNLILGVGVDKVL